MLKYLLILFSVVGCSFAVNAQSFNDNAREEFIEQMTSFAKKSEKFIQQAAQFKGGNGALFDYLQSHIIYPEEAKKEGLSAQVFVSFMVDWKTGLPKDVKIIQSSNKLFEAETLRLIKAMPAWVPAKQDGKDVSMIMTIPVYFHLN